MPIRRFFTKAANEMTQTITLEHNNDAIRAPIIEARKSLLKHSPYTYPLYIAIIIPLKQLRGKNIIVARYRLTR